MNTENKFYSIIIIISLLFWNPYIFNLLYSSTMLRGSKIFSILFSILFFTGICTIVLIQKNILTGFLKNFSLTIAILGITFAGFVVLDRGYGIIQGNNGDKYFKGLIFEPNSSAVYKSSEFEFEAKINSIGLRNDEISIDETDNFRILCFGDSWTYGWGVNNNDAWPQKLELYLEARGFDKIEVINCGQPGQYTSTEVSYVEKIVPLLNPDLVLIGVLQLDDLSQIYSNKFSKEEVFNKLQLRKIYFNKFKDNALKFLLSSFTNIIDFSKPVNVSDYWKKQNNSMLKNFDHWQNIRFNTLDKTVQDMFRSGDLKPGLLDYYINFPDRILIFNNPEHPATKFATNVMLEDIGAMRQICDKSNTEMVFVNIPMNYFTGHFVVRNPSDILNSYFYSHNNIDEIYKTVADVNNVTYFELTDHFSNLLDKSNYLFKYDGHPNENGYNEIAEYIGQQLIDMKYIQ